MYYNRNVLDPENMDYIGPATMESQVDYLANIEQNGTTSNDDAGDLYSKLVKIKTQLSDSIQDLMAKKVDLNDRLSKIRVQKETKREDLNRLMTRKLVLQLDIELAKNQVEIDRKYSLDMSEAINNFEKLIEPAISVHRLQESVNQHIESLIGEITIHQEDSLQLELMRRNQAVQEKRVELANADDKVAELKRSLELKKQEIERAKREEEERLRREEENRRQEELARSRLEIRAKQQQQQEEVNLQPRNQQHITKPIQNEQQNQSMGSLERNHYPGFTQLANITISEPIAPKNSTPKQSVNSSTSELLDWANLLSW